MDTTEYLSSPIHSLPWFQLGKVHPPPPEGDRPKHLPRPTLLAGVLQVLERQDRPHRRGLAPGRRECHLSSESYLYYIHKKFTLRLIILSLIRP